MNINPRIDESKNRCINCGLTLHGAQRNVDDLEPNELEVLRRWVEPRNMPSSSWLCLECQALVISRAVSPDAPPEVGHSLVCMTCGMSQFRRQYINYDPAAVKEADRPMMDIIVAWTHEFKELRCPIVCRPCRQAAQRIITVKNKPRAKPKVEEEVHPPRPPPRLPLPPYRRALCGGGGEGAGGRCMAAGCESPPAPAPAPAPLRSRQAALRQHLLYVPPSGRLCRGHGSPDWAAVAAGRGRATFTAEQIEDMVFLLRNHRPVDFGNVEGMDEHLRRRWLGLGLEEFRERCGRAPALAVAVRAASRRTGEGRLVLASLFQVTPGDIDECLRLAECLDDDKPAKKLN